jgi:hypothetical protein
MRVDMQTQGECEMPMRGWRLMSEGGRGYPDLNATRVDVVERLRACAQSISTIIDHMHRKMDDEGNFYDIDGDEISMEIVLAILSHLTEKRDLLYAWAYDVECGKLSHENVILDTIEKDVDDFMDYASKVLK